MKKRIISLVLICVCTCSFIGCKANVLEVNNNKQNNNDIIDTQDKYIVDDVSYDVYYDVHTKIVYLHQYNSSGYQNIIPLIDCNGKAMNIEEYNNIK